MRDTSWIQRHKTLARALLYSLPVVFVGAVWLVIVLTRPSGRGWDWQGIDFTQYDSIELLREYLRIDTSWPNGDELPGAEFLARELRKVGAEVHLERLGDHHANLWAILEGEDPKALVLHNHIDVDPISRPEEWLYDPFGGELDPPYIYGRGAFDMKSVGIAQLAAFKAVASRGKPLRRSLIFLATGDEERESWMGTRWILGQHPELVERMGVVLTEGGAVEAIDLDLVKYWGTENIQKRFIELRVCHGNRAALEGLRADLLSQDDQPYGKPQISPEIARFIEIYGRTRERNQFQELLADPYAVVHDAGFAMLPRNVKSMLRNEIVAWPVEEDPEGGYSLRVILHLLPWVTVEEGFAELLPGGLPGYAVQVSVSHGIVPSSPIDHPVFQEIQRIMEEAYPEVPHGPLFVPWSATDARFFRAAGIPAYGYSPFIMISSDTGKMSGPNERIPAPAFLEGVDLYVDLVRKLVEE